MKLTSSMTLVAAALALAGCGGGKKAAVANTTGGGGDALETSAASVPGLRDGALWTCQISDYDPQPCKLSKADGGWRLVKVLGSQRFEGRVAVEGRTMSFDGQFYCPWGACDQAMRVDFAGEGDDGTYIGLYATEFDGDRITVRYDEALESEYGAAGYGGLTGREQ